MNMFSTKTREWDEIWDVQGIGAQAGMAGFVEA